MNENSHFDLFEPLFSFSIMLIFEISTRGKCALENMEKEFFVASQT